MKSRLAIIAVLATGALMSSGGAALGISALSTDLTAGAAQYGVAAQQPGAGGVLGVSAAGGEAGVTGAPDSRAGGVAGAQASVPGAGAQAPRQLAASEAAELPFTGYAAIPLLLVGLALLTSGLVLHRRARHPRGVLAD